VSDRAETTIPDTHVAIDELGVSLRSGRLLTVVSSAVVGGGSCRVRDITEAKTMVLGEWQVRTAQGQPASGTSTDSVVVAATGRGPALSYAGPATTIGWLAARTTRQAIEQICAAKLARDGGRPVSAGSGRLAGRDR
jgi:Adenosylcobinamide amidohydrolase